MKEKRGFTLLEMIVTVAILFTLLSILVPTMSGFAKSAGDQISDSNLELLNFATHSYASFHEIENKDIFESVADDAARQQVLVSDGLIEQPVHPNGEGDYCWNITDQKWIRYVQSTEGCGGSYKPSSNPDGSLTPDDVKKPEPTVYPSSKPMPTYIPSPYKAVCEASKGQFDIVAETCSCPAGYVLEGTEKKDGVEYKVCIPVEQYMCVSSGGTYDKATQACTCSGDLILDDNTKMCVFDQEKANKQKCVADGGQWIVENGSGYCKKEETNTYPIVVDKNNPNFIHAAYMLKGKEGDGLFDVFKDLDNLEDLAKGNNKSLPPGSYFYYKGNLYRVNNQISVSQNTNLDQLVSNSTDFFNVSTSGEYNNSTEYSKNAYASLNGIWYRAKNAVRSSPAIEPYAWYNCGNDINKLNEIDGCDPSKGNQGS